MKKFEINTDMINNMPEEKRMLLGFFIRVTVYTELDLLKIEFLAYRNRLLSLTRGKYRKVW